MGKLKIFKFKTEFRFSKRNTSRKLQMENKEFNKEYWRQHLWAIGHFRASGGIILIYNEYLPIVTK
jgi:hypothetical protein